MITSTGRQGADDSFAPTDLLAIVLGVITAWFAASPALRAFEGEDAWSPERLARHRTAVIEATRRIVAV